jgi:hypothetical protein
VVDDGVTGFIVHSLDEAMAAVRRLPALDRAGVRATFERRFSATIMSRNYLALYARLAQCVHGSHAAAPGHDDPFAKSVRALHA